MQSEKEFDDIPTNSNLIDENAPLLNDNQISDKCDIYDSESVSSEIKSVVFKDKFNSSSECLSDVSYSEEGPARSCLAMTVVYMNFTYKFILALSISVVVITMIVSFYTIIILNYVFIISTIVSYALSPIFHGLQEDWLQYIFSVIQLFVINPLIEFIIYFVIKTVKNFADSIFEFGTLIKLSFVTAFNSGHSKYDTAKNFLFSADINILRQSGLVLASLLALGGAGAIVYLTFFIDKCMIALGMIPEIAMVLQICCLLLPTYSYYLRILIGSKKFNANCLEEFINDKIEEYNDLMDDNDEKYANQEDERIQTYESAFVEEHFEALEMSSESVFNSGEDDSEEEKQRQDEQEKLLRQALVNITPLFVAIEYTSLYDYILQIAHDRFNKKKKRFLLIFFTVLNFVVIGFDIYRLIRDFNYYFLVSLIIRIILFPFFCFFNIGTAFIYKAKSASVHFVIMLSTAFTFIIFIASILFALCYRQLVYGIPRIDSLNYVPNDNVSNVNLFHDACVFNFEGLSLIQAFGLAMGPYDVERDFLVFDNQMKYFFGPDWRNNITYEVHHIDKKTPFIIYNFDNNLTVYGFRGFSSGTELCLHIEMLTIEYALPFLQDVIPFYSVFIDHFIGFYAQILHYFGNQFFDPVTVASSFITPVEEIIDSRGYTDDDKILFTGINIGGMFSKVLGMIYKKHGIGFVSLPSFNDYFLNDFDIDDDDSMHVTNVYNYNGWFTKQEPDLATNIGVPWIPSPLPIERDSVYRTFCTIAEMCGQGPHFYNYCSTVVDDIESISEFFSENND